MLHVITLESDQCSCPMHVLAIPGKDSHWTIRVPLKYPQLAEGQTLLLLTLALLLVVITVARCCVLNFCVTAHVLLKCSLRSQPCDRYSRINARLPILWHYCNIPLLSRWHTFPSFLGLLNDSRQCALTPAE